jgi:tRNA/tmRNA/rRNA uracil-C5-methylase (TrmA/RlmC/RlmD family)
VQLVSECEVVGVQTARAFGTPASSPAVSAPSRAAAPDGPRDAGVPQTEVWELSTLIPDEREVTITVDSYTWRLHTRAFFQVNRHLLGTMLRLVHAQASSTRGRHLAYDLYGGVGFFTLPIAQQFHRVTMVVGSPISVRYAKMNVPRHVKVVSAPVEQHIESMREADYVFLDPPRSGAKRVVIDTIAERTREKISFLACDPVTFARDASRILASGWKLASLDLLDLFPNTHHVETLASFER